MTTETKKRAIVEPFGVEATGHANNDLIVQSIKGCRLRSVIKTIKRVTGVKRGIQTEVRDVPAHGLGLPQLPGMQVHVNPARLTYVITDPMFDDEELCEKVRQALNSRENSPFRIDEKVKGVAPQKGTLDEHRMKTLCREIICMLDSGDMTSIKGPTPTMERVEELPGNFLLNPGASSFTNCQPMFEKDFPAWHDKLIGVAG